MRRLATVCSLKKRNESPPMNDKQAIPWDKHDPPYSMIADQNRSVIQKKYIPHFQSASNGPRSKAPAARVAATSPPCAVTPSRTADTLAGTMIEQCHTQITSCGSRGAVCTDRDGCPDGCWNFQQTHRLLLNVVSTMVAIAMYQGL